MPKMSADTSRFFARHPVFRLDEFRAVLGGNRSDHTVRARIKQFLASGRLQILSPGIYAVTPPGEDTDTFHADPLLVASRLARDSVVAYHSAFELLGYARQVFSLTTYMTAGHRRRRELGTHEFVALAPPRKIKERWDHIAVETMERQGLAVRVTCRERTLIDCLDRFQYSGGLEELLACVGSLPSVDFELTEHYLDALGSPTLYARVGFVLERFADRLFFDQRWQARFSRKAPRSPCYLLRRQAGCALVRPWQLLVPRDSSAR